MEIRFQNRKDQTALGQGFTTRDSTLVPHVGDVVEIPGAIAKVVFRRLLFGTDGKLEQVILDCDVQSGS